MTPDRTIAQQEIEGHKKDKVSILQNAYTNTGVCTDILCSRGLQLRSLQMLMALTSAAFLYREIQEAPLLDKKSGQAHGFRYRNNTKAWMTDVLFQEWLANLDKIMKMRSHLKI